jgi:serine/threonine protein kinase
MSIAHQHVADTYDVITDGDYSYVVSEYAPNGTLAQALAANPAGNIAEGTARDCFRQIVAAVGHLHTVCGMPHGDIRPESILFDGQFRVRLAPAFRPASGSAINCVAPEVLMGSELGQAADIWSLGVVLFLITTGSFPWAGPSIPRLVREIVDADVPIPNALSPPLVDLLGRLLDRDPRRRPAISDIIDDPWVGPRGQTDTFQSMIRGGGDVADRIARKAAFWRGIGSGPNGVTRIASARPTAVRALVLQRIRERNPPMHVRQGRSVPVFRYQTR